MSGAVNNTIPPDLDPATQAAINGMTAAFELAIKTNATITTTKTELGAIETAAQQRPNIG